MASTVKAELDKANPNNVADLFRLAKIGSGLAVTPRSELVTVASHLGTLSQPAAAILHCYATVGTTMGVMHPVASLTTPSTTECAVNEAGQVEFAAGDAVTAAEVTYVPIEEDLITETIPVTAGGLGTFNASKSCAQLVSATLNSPASVAGLNTALDRGTLIGVLATTQCAVQFAGTTVQFYATDAGSVCTADVVYHAFPGVGTGSKTALGDRLDATYTP